MVMVRDTGWFVKLFDEKYSNLDSHVFKKISATGQDIIMAAFEAGYRMIEFDCDATEYDGFEIFE